MHDIMSAATNPFSTLSGAPHDQIACQSADDLAEHAEELQREGRVRVPGFLSYGAQFLHDFLNETDEWIQVINTEKGVLEIDMDEWQQYDSRKRAQIERDMYARASRGFQYSYSAISIAAPHELEAYDCPLTNFARFMARPDTKKVLQSLTGHADLKFTDGQATAYHAGDILTGHDDAVAGKNRIAAFVMGLTPVWRLEWGGLLHFHGEDKESALALVPQFNTLDLFSVPRLHSVSQVSPAALYPRYAITGWLSKS